MNIFLVALKKRLENGEITQEVYDSMAEELVEEVVEPIEVIPEPTEIEKLQIRQSAIEDAINFILGL